MKPPDIVPDGYYSTGQTGTSDSANVLSIIVLPLRLVSPDPATRWAPIAPNVQDKRDCQGKIEADADFFGHDAATAF